MAQTTSISIHKSVEKIKPVFIEMAELTGSGWNDKLNDLIRLYVHNPEIIEKMLREMRETAKESEVKSVAD